MKNLLKNKKVLVSLAIACIMSASGITYAWFTSGPIGIGATAQMGSLRLETKQYEDYALDADPDTIIRCYFNEYGVRYYIDDKGKIFSGNELDTLLLDYSAVEDWFEMDLYYAPGSGGMYGFELKNPAMHLNVATIDEMIKVGQLECNEIIIKADSDGNALPAPIVYNDMADFLADYPGSVNFAAEDIEHCFYYDNFNDQNIVGYALWMLDANANEYYLLLSSGMQYDMLMSLEFDKSMGNEFMASKFSFSAEFRSSQPDTAATKDIFGVAENAWVPAILPIKEVFMDNSGPVPAPAPIRPASGAIVNGDSYTAQYGQYKGMTADEIIRTLYPDMFK